MLGKLFQKSTDPSSSQETARNVSFHVSVHYGIPSTASNLAYDPIQHLVAVGTLDGRIKVIGGDNVEGLLMSPKPMPFKHLEFLQNQGFLVSVTNENEIQVWDLESRCISCNLLWESHITAFSVIYGTQFMYVGDEHGFLYVLKYDAEEGKIHQLPYHIPANVLAETADVSFSHDQSIVGVFAQPSSSGNRVLVAYEHGLIVLWDISEDKAVLVRGYKDLELKDETLTGSPNDGAHGYGDDIYDHEQEGKEISSLCWLSADGSILAVGYVDGDILIWNLLVSESNSDEPSSKSPDKVIKLQLSSGERRLPVIVLHWSSYNKAQNDCRGQLFVYGGEEIGSEEVLTILDLDWSTGIAMLKCVHRVDLPLSGSFADMIVMGTSRDLEQKGGASSLLILTNPGQLLYYDNACLSTLKSDPDKKHSLPVVQYPATIPTVEPHLTVGKLHSVVMSGGKSLAFAETVSAAKNTRTRGGERWPLTGGVSYQPSRTEDKGIKKIYIAGYQDGSIRIWDATFPVLSLILVLKNEVKGIEIPGVDAPISAVEFSSSSSNLAIGNEFGLVCLYFLDQKNDKSSLIIVTQTQREVQNLPSQNGPQCTAIFSLVNSPVHCLHWVSPGCRLAVGFKCGQVAMLDINSLSVLYLTDITSISSIISFATKTLPFDENDSHENQSEGGISIESLKEVAVILTKDAHIILTDITTGKKIHQPMHPKEASAITLCVLDENASVSKGSEGDSHMSSQEVEGKSQSQPEGPVGDGDHKQPKFIDTTVLLCCEKKLRLYSLKSLIQGNLKAVSKLKLLKPCVWATVFKKDTTKHGLIIVYQSGEIEIRSLPDFTVLGSTSLMSLLRWNPRTNMEKKMSSDKGNLTLVNGSEFAILSLSPFENDFRIPEALPCLHDKVLAAAADAAVNSHYQKNKQHVLGGIIKSLKGTKKDTNNYDAGKHFIAHLDDIFSRFPFSDPSKNVGAVELDIDDINIDEPASLPSPSVTSKVDRKEKGTEREKLFEGGSTDTKPRTRTREEIIAKYRKAGDATAAASQAKDKLLERQEKLEKLSKRTEELQSGAENFASLANELAKTMERRSKWWKI